MIFLLSLQAPVGSDEICFLAELFNLNLTPGENSCRPGQGSINQQNKALLE